MRRIVLAVMIVMGLGSRAGAQPTTNSSVDAENTCIKISDPRGAVVVRGQATSGSALTSISILGVEIVVTCQPEPPAPGSIVSVGGLSVKKIATLADEKVVATGGRKSLSIAKKFNLRTYAKMCADGGHPPFASMTVRWTVSATDEAGATGKASGSLTAACDDGTSSCLSKPVPKRASCEGDSCACGLRCCPYVADPDSRCVSDALCRRLQRQQEERDLPR